VSLLSAIAIRAARTLLLVSVAAAGTVLLVRFAPGFFSDAREMDAKYAEASWGAILLELDDSGLLARPLILDSFTSEVGASA